MKFNGIVLLRCALCVYINVCIHMNIMGKENFIPDNVFPLHNNAKLLTTESMIY